MHDSRYAKRREGGVDFIGISLLAIGLGSLQMMLDEGTREGWFDSDFIVWLFICALVGLVTFVIWELRVKHPVINLRVLKHRSFAAGTVFGMALGFGLFGGIFILPIFLQNVRGFSALQTGLIMMPAALASAVVMPLTGQLVNRMSPRNLVVVGVIGVTASMFMLSGLTSDTGTAQLYPALIVRGMAMGFLWSPLALATLAGLKGQEMAEGAALFNLSRQLGGSAGIAFLSTFLEAREKYHYARLSEHVSLYAPATMNRFLQLWQFFLSKGSSQVVAQYEAIGVLYKITRGQAAILAYEDIFRIMAIIFASTLVLVFLLDKRRPAALARSAAERVAE
jgi:DHA2 family multidrug resistance protein